MSEYFEIKMKEKIELAEKADHRFAEMEEKEEFMDGEMVYRSGFARGKLIGLQVALKMFEDDKAGCSFCNPNHDDYLQEECLCEDRDGNYEIVIETSQWDDYLDSFVVVGIGNVKFCPYCGRKMTNS